LKSQTRKERGTGIWRKVVHTGQKYQWAAGINGKSKVSTKWSFTLKRVSLLHCPFGGLLGGR
jgi:hypothetical protein